VVEEALNVTAILPKETGTSLGHVNKAPTLSRVFKGVMCTKVSQSQTTDVTMSFRDFLDALNAREASDRAVRVASKAICKARRAKSARRAKKASVTKAFRASVAFLKELDEEDAALAAGEAAN
jgi:hypothetical protein